MVTEVHKGKTTLYRCDVCGLLYREKQIAEKCQHWCETHEGSCNLEYALQAVSEHEANTEGNGGRHKD